MKVTKEILESKKVRLEIHVDPETFEEGMQKSYIKNRKGITIPGFRKGKAPRKIIERYYGEAIFYEDAINEVFPKVYDEAVKETGIEPVAMPDVDIVQIGDGQQLILTADVDVKPEVQLGQYKGIEVEKVEYTVSDHDVEHQLEHIREDNARWINIEDRSIQNGDLVTLDYAGTIDGEAFDGGTAEKQTLEIGSGRFIPGFEEQLTGLSLEEEKDITVTFPEDYHAEELKGKEAVFHVKIHEIKEKELPALDDEFAKDVSEFSSLEEYKADLKRKLVESAEQNARSQMENQLLSKITENATVDIPDVMIENEIDSLVQDMEMRMRYSGLSLQNYLEMSNTSLEEFRAQYRDNAYNRVKTRLVLEAVTKAEDITVTDEDREKEYQKLAKQYQRDVEEIKKTFAANSEYMDDSVLVQKTIDFLLESAVMVEPEEDKTDASAAEHDHGHEHREPDQAEAEKQQTEGVEEQSNNE
ncbi:MAG TPA: trigger factor [Clostridiales bacterium]|nr:trigger factor [Clostridiales bacterium]